MLTLALAADGPLYDRTVCSPPRWDHVSLADLRNWLRDELRESGRSLHVRHDGVVERVWPKPEGKMRFRRFDRWDLYAVQCARRRAAGAEADLVLGSPPQAMTVWVDADRIVLERGGAIPPLREVASPEELEARWGLDLVAETPWTPRVLGALDRALAALDSRELDRVRTVPVIRRAGTPPIDEAWGNAAGRFNEEGVLIYDTLLEDAAGSFVGPADEPHHPLVYTLVHEMAHALDHLGRQDGVRPSDRFAERTGGLEVTKYAGRNSREAFAEAFALYRLDPAALRRIDANADRFFAEGLHVAQ